MIFRSFRPPSGNEFKNKLERLKRRIPKPKKRFRPPSGNEFKNFISKNGCSITVILVFVPLRGMSLKTINLLKVKIVIFNEGFRPPSGNEFKNPYFFLKFFVKI